MDRQMETGKEEKKKDSALGGSKLGRLVSKYRSLYINSTMKWYTTDCFVCRLPNVQG